MILFEVAIRTLPGMTNQGGARHRTGW